jgi:hypothetical protein
MSTAFGLCAKTSRKFVALYRLRSPLRQYRIGKVRQSGSCRSPVERSSVSMHLNHPHSKHSRQIKSPHGKSSVMKPST